MPFSGFQDLDPAFGSSLQAMIAARPGIFVNSGYRTIARQQFLWDRALKKYGSPEAARKWVAPPGHSMHNKRLASDLGFKSAADEQWAHQHAADYGLRFRMGHEPWHIEPIKGFSGTPSHVDAPLKVTAGGANAFVNKDMTTMLSKEGLDTMKPKITGGLQASTDPTPVSQWPMTGPPLIEVNVDGDKKRRPLGKASQALADAAAEMQKGKDASWAWVQEAMRPRPAAGPPMWMGSPLWL